MLNQEDDSSFNLKLWVFNKRSSLTVTRFGEISPKWQYFRSLGQFLEGSCVT